jgi:hypothetical protein
MTPGQLFAFAALAANRWRAQQISSLAQMALAFRGDSHSLEKAIRTIPNE